MANQSNEGEEAPRLHDLWQKWAEGESSLEETEELFQAIRATSGENWNDLLASEWNKLTPGETRPWIDWEGMFTRITTASQQLADPSNLTDAPQPIRARIIRFSKWRIAAIWIGAVLTAGLAWFFIHRGASPPVAATAGNQPTISDARPGGDRATLTLANGSTITLDSAANGALALQGGTRIQKISNGQLLYKAASLSNSQQPTDLNSKTYNTLTTPRGGQYQLTLPDGSKVWLNAASSLRYPTDFSGRARTVELTGEAYFEIAKNASKPFRVMSGPMQVDVLGTRFDIMAYPEESTQNTTLVDGAVRVSVASLAHTLNPGYQTVLDPARHTLDAAPADLQKALAWKNGIFEFDRMDLPSILRQLSRWYDVDLVYQAPAARAALGGSISKNMNLSEIIKLLEANGVNHFRLEGKKLIVLP